MAIATVQWERPKARKLNPLRGYGAQFNTNLFTTAGESTPLSHAELEALVATVQTLKPGHSRIFVRPDAREPGKERTALMSTIELADRAGANINLTWWKGPFPHEPVRTLDALHLATAAIFAQALGSLCVASLDDRVRTNAKAMGMSLAPS